MPRRVTILGSTGSIGRSALSVIAGLPEHLCIAGLAAGTQWELLARQAAEAGASAVAISDDRSAEPLRAALSAAHAPIPIYAGNGAMVDLVRRGDADMVVAAVVGAVGLPAVLAAVERGLPIALANKETLVVAGEILAPLARRTGSVFIPIDSEHSAIFQALQCGRVEEVERIYLTASGGPFRTWPAERMQSATLEDALNHPVWSMGPKISIDSATMMNKALEIIEARWLFNLDPDRIEVLVHPESAVHSMVEFRDGSVIAQIGVPDMRVPTQYALTWPARLAGQAERLDFRKLGRMHFEAPDPVKFPALRLGHEVARLGGAAGAVLNAANEAAVDAFRRREISFGRIVPLVEEVLRKYVASAAAADGPPDAGRGQPAKPESAGQAGKTLELSDILKADAWARREVMECI